MWDEGGCSFPQNFGQLRCFGQQEKFGQRQLIKMLSSFFIDRNFLFLPEVGIVKLVKAMHCKSPAHAVFRKRFENLP